ncbi:MAG TPA: DUF6421 family protein [Thermoleophilia bacterium]|jgi:hypothetical protein|nr:DUF6421 family protein [Thermoleophilia bacterium]
MTEIGSVLHPPMRSAAAEHPAWRRLAAAVEEIRPLQSKDGSIDAAAHDLADARSALGTVLDALAELAPLFPHDAAYHRAVAADLRKWADGGFGVPDFLDSLLEFHPERQREDGLEHLVVFPMYTQNGNPDRNLEAVLFRVVWPDWLAELERSRYDNPMFVPITFEAFTAGYDTNSAVLFPETVAVREVPVYTWGAIFCDREAARFRAVVTAAAATTRLNLPADTEALLNDHQTTQDTFALWDMIHDRTHSHGDLPFDPFMIKQRMPYWLYSLEELRCDLTTFREAVRLEAQGLAQARPIQYAILFDRLFRFPITGNRVRNYDGLGGQLLFAYLHKNDVLRWTDNTLRIDWDQAAPATVALLERIETLYRDGIDRPKTAHWIAAYELVAEFVTPHPASTWARGLYAPWPEVLPLDGAPKELVNLVLADEFPLSMFYEALEKKLRPVIASTKGITAATATGTTAMGMAASTEREGR